MTVALLGIGLLMAIKGTFLMKKLLKVEPVDGRYTLKHRTGVFVGVFGIFVGSALVMTGLQMSITDFAAMLHRS